MEITYTCKRFDALSVHELYRIYRLRSAVFVVEQACAYQDVDEKDIPALHLCAWMGDELAAYARLLPAGVSYASCSIGRVVTAPEFRGKKLGDALMRKAIVLCGEHFDTDTITISAQCYLQRFYENLGFIGQGESYLEDAIPHLKMIYHAS